MWTTSPHQWIDNDNWQILHEVSLSIYWWGEAVHTGYLKSDIVSTDIII